EWANEMVRSRMPVPLFNGTYFKKKRALSGKTKTATGAQATDSLRSRRLDRGGVGDIGQLEPEAGAAPERALYVDRLAVGLEDLLDDAEAQPRATAFARPIRVYAVEALEDAVEVFLGDAFAGVHDLHAHLVDAAAQAQAHGAFVRVGDGVVDE